MQAQGSPTESVITDKASINSWGHAKRKTVEKLLSSRPDHDPSVFIARISPDPMPSAMQFKEQLWFASSMTSEMFPDTDIWTNVRRGTKNFNKQYQQCSKHSWVSHREDSEMHVQSWTEVGKWADLEWWTPRYFKRMIQFTRKAYRPRPGRWGLAGVGWGCWARKLTRHSLREYFGYK